MLFKRRVSFQGALNVRRRVYDEMAALGAPVRAQHGAQSHQQPAAVSFGTPLPRTVQPIPPSTQTSLPSIDCRWKRGRPVAFSSRTFSTRPANYDEHAVQVHDQGVEIALGQSRQHEQVGNKATADQQLVPTDSLAHTVQHDDTYTQREYVAVSEPSSNAASAMDATVSPSTHSPTLDCESQNSAPFTIAHSTARSSSEGGVLDDTSDTDGVPLTPDDDESTSESTSEPTSSEADEADEEPSETHTPLKFQIPEEILRAAMTAPENSKASYWSNTLYRDPEGLQILVHYCKTKEVAERVAKRFVNEAVVGFDIEWKPYSSPESIKKNVSLIQLASEDRIALFHIALFQGSTAAQLLPPTLKAILESPDIYKAGVAIKGDFSRVSKFLGVEPQGVFELSRLHNLVEHFASSPSKVNNKLMALAMQVQKHLQLPLYKGGHLVDDPEDSCNVRSSDWSLPLNYEQIHYAAADAYAGFRLFDVLEEKRKLLKPTPPRPPVCDYDLKVKPRSSVSKPRKKRTSVTKDKDTVSDVVEGSGAATGETDEPDEGAEEKPDQSQDTEGYETAQEDLLDSHQLEGEEPTPSEEIHESMDESSDAASEDSEVSLTNDETAAARDASQRRVGRINLSRLRDSDPGYPKLPELRNGEDTDCLAREDIINFLGRLENTNFGYKSEQAGLVSGGEEEDTDEFDDSELEEALQDLSIGSDGLLQQAAAEAITVEPNESSAQLHPMKDGTLRMKKKPLSDEADVKTGPAPTNDAALEEEDMRPIDPTNDPGAASAPAVPVLAPGPSPVAPPAPPPVASTGLAAEQPEVTLATSWARSYLSSTIPPPGSLTSSHIRATVPHLRAYHMWHHQQLPLSEIAAQLRDPPLPESTVGSYVLQAITLERMEYDVSAVRGVLMGMPEALRRGKWRGLAEKVGAR